MGMSASPASLDIVGLAAEVVRLSNTIQSTVPTKMEPYLSTTSLELSKTAITEYARYQDDTEVIASSTSTEILKHLILNVGTMFPEQIPINVDLSHIFYTFLDVACLKKISSSNMETFLKKKFNAALKIVPESSMTPSKLKFSTLRSELVRIRRICSKPKFVDIYDHLLEKEYNERRY